MTKLTREDVIEKYNKGESLSRLDLSGLDLSNSNLFGANLHKANLYKANLSNTDLSFANLTNTNLSFADLSKTNLSRAYLLYADLSYADLSGANLTNVDLDGANLTDIIGNNILTFEAYDKHFAYFCGGIVSIGCQSRTLDDWLSNYKELAKIYNYDEKAVKAYLNFINHCKELNSGNGH